MVLISSEEIFFYFRRLLVFLGLLAFLEVCDVLVFDLFVWDF